MNLGNLSAMKEIPKYYITMILQYIMQTSLGFIQAHSNDLIHGHFNLSKVIAQKMDVVFDKESSFQKNNEAVENMASPKKDKEKPEGELAFDAVNMPDYYYLLTNFEPWAVDQMMKNFQGDENSTYFDAL